MVPVSAEYFSDFDICLQIADQYFIRFLTGYIFQTK